MNRAATSSYAPLTRASGEGSEVRPLTAAHPCDNAVHDQGDHAGSPLRIDRSVTDKGGCDSPLQLFCLSAVCPSVRLPLRQAQAFPGAVRGPAAVDAQAVAVDEAGERWVGQEGDCLSDVVGAREAGDRG